MVREELIFLESYGTCDVTDTVTVLLWRQFLITISDKHRNSPAVNIKGELTANSNSPPIVLLIFGRISC